MLDATPDTKSPSKQPSGKKKYGTKCALVYDHGTFCELARTLSKDFGRVYYYSPWEASYPRSNPLLIGSGLEGVIRVPNIWDVLPDVELCVFPDVYDGALQMHLVSLGKRVWGSRKGEQLELERVASKEYQKSVGIDIGPYEVVKGMDALREYLKQHENVWIKLSATRGDAETFRSKHYDLIKPRLDELEFRLGAKAAVKEFIVEESIEPATEVGYDGFTIDGAYAKTALYGIEVKDKGYIGRVKPYAQLPKAVTDVNAKLASAFKSYQYRGFFSTELRLTKEGKAYSIDPCCRQGSPPSELYMLMISNISELIYEGAGGKLVEPQFRGKWGAELLIHSSWAERNWQAIEFPDDMRENVKLRNLAQFGNGKLFVVPDTNGAPEIGAVVAYGDTMEAAIEECKSLAERLEGYYVEVMPDALDEAEQSIADLKEYGINF